MHSSVDPAIGHAWTLPSEFYTSPESFERSKEAVFARSWQFLCDTDLVRAPGQVQPLTLLEGFLDEPLLLTRDTDDRVHLMSNVCTHRGNLVCEGAGHERFLRCRYHGRRFGLDGSFQHMPEFEGVAGFPAESDSLPTVRHGLWDKLLFASLDPAVPLESAIAEMQARVGWLPLHEFSHDPSRSRDYLVKANWALYCDNYLEGFHIPFIHADLNATLDYGDYTVELFPHSSLQLAVAKGAEDVFDLPKSSPDYGRSIAAYYFWLFPNTMFNFYPWGAVDQRDSPIGSRPDQSIVRLLRVGLDQVRPRRGRGFRPRRAGRRACRRIGAEGRQVAILRSRPLFGVARAGDAPFSPFAQRSDELIEGLIR